MKAIRVNFSADGAEIDFNSQIENFWPTVQNTTVFTGQKLNTDKIFPDKGTNLHKNAVSGGLVTAGAFINALKELAIDAQTFTQETEDEDNNEHELRLFRLHLDTWLGDVARVRIAATSNKGESIDTNYILT